MATTDHTSNNASPRPRARSRSKQPGSESAMETALRQARAASSTTATHSEPLTPECLKTAMLGRKVVVSIRHPAAIVAKPKCDEVILPPARKANGPERY